MLPEALPVDPRRRSSSLLRFQIRHLAVLVLLVAVAITDIRSHRPQASALVMIAAAGYAGFVMLCWLIWHVVQRYERQLGRLLATLVYAVTMSVIFMVATLTYLLIESWYLGFRIL
jgi:hypothetical protein